MSEAIVIGLGTPDRGDDAAGLEAARLFAALSPPGVLVLSLPGQTAALLDLWIETPLAVIIDAAVSGAPPGTIHEVDAHAGPLSAGSPHRSTHDLGLADIVELGRVLGRLPPRLVILGIEVADCAPGAGLSPAVQRGLRRAVRRALAALAGQDVRRPPVAIREPAGSSALP